MVARSNRGLDIIHCVSLYLDKVRDRRAVAYFFAVPILSCCAETAPEPDDKAAANVRYSTLCGRNSDLG
jgi:hypothetical protein